jgi:ATP-dependent helicase/DNAse subunit B
MQSLVKELNHICTQFPFQEKIIIVDSHSVGEQMIEAYTRAGHKAINLKYYTAFDLARQEAELSSTQPLNLIDPTVAVHLTHRLLTILKDNGRLHYFNDMEITPSFSHSINNMLQTLRMAGYTKDHVSKTTFISAAKADDVTEILTEYETLLYAESFVDRAALFTKALETVNVDSSKVYLLQSHLQLTYIEEQFLSRLLSESVVKLPVAPVFGVQPPEGTSLGSIRTGEPTVLSYLYQLEETSKQADLHIFTAKTEELEVKQILEKIKKEGTALDECVIYYTSGETYSTLFFQMTNKLAIPVTFAEGLSIMFSRPGRFLSGIIDWIQSNYSVQSFIQSLHEGVWHLGEGAPSKTKIAKVLRDLKVGWRPDRYLHFLKVEIERLEKQVAEQPMYAVRLNELIWLFQWFTKLFNRLPLLDETMNYQTVLKGVSFLLKNHTQTSSALDELSKTAMLEAIEKVIPYADESLSRYDVFEKLKDLLLTIKVNASRAKPGHLHIASYKSGIYNSRSHLFVVGLDHKKFPGTAGEDPLLLDTERVQLYHALPLMREKGQENLYTLLQVLAGSTGPVTVSYCHFDMNGNRVMNPAFVVLQCYRLMTGNKEAEFKELKSLAASLVSTDIFEEKDFWNEQLVSEEKAAITSGLLEYFEHLPHGLHAENSRNQESFTHYDGKVDIDAALFDPCQNQEKTVSSSKLENLAKCPYSYFLKEVLKLKPVEDVSFDANRWLDSASRGNLLHRIFEQFYKQLQLEQMKPIHAIHLERLLTLATALVEEYKELLPPPNERVYIRELTDILDCCNIFLREEEQHAEQYEPLHFEYTFGRDGKEPAVITLPSGEIKVSGIVDRVDRASSGSYHIIDYKTGSTYGYDKSGAFKGGRQLQHMIYALAIEQHLNLEEGSVTESSYYFPTVKGMADRYSRMQDTALRTSGMEILEKLIDIIRNGHFEMTDDVNDCKYCEFKLVCRRHFYQEDVLEMKQSNQKLKGVRIYD